MRRSGFMLALGLSLLPLAAARGLDAPKPGPDWEQARKDNELVIYYRDAPTAEARDLRATGEVNAAPEVVFNAVTDFENYPKFMPYTKEARIVQRVSDNVVLGYSLLNPPLVSARDYCIQLTFTKGSEANGGVFKSEWTAKPSAVPVRDGTVRVQVNNGSWLMEPIDGGHRTRVTYSLFTNPGGSIPRWLANMSNTTAIPELFKAVRKRATGKE